MLFPQKSGRRFQEFLPSLSDHWAVTAVGDHPKTGLRNSFSHFEREVDGIQRVAIALHDQSPA